jgi:hypothetical protein
LAPSGPNSIPYVTASHLRQLRIIQHLHSLDNPSSARLTFDEILGKMMKLERKPAGRELAVTGAQPPSSFQPNVERMEFQVARARTTMVRE